MTSHSNLALVLSGGNALGSYQAGVYEALHEASMEPDWVSGASTGAVNGALICGNAPDDRLSSLRQLWQPSDRKSLMDPWRPVEDVRRSLAATMSLLGGRPTMFTPRHLYGPWWNPLANPAPASLFDTIAMDRTLADLIDAEQLNSGRPRFTVAAVDLESGEDVIFDNHREPLDVRHIRASAALLPAFPPVRIGERLLGDAGLSLNLPLDAVLLEACDTPLLCLAVDVMPLGGTAPSGLGEAAERMQDLVFAAQTRRALACWQALFESRSIVGRPASVTLIHLVYTDQEREVCGKGFDFSAASAHLRWQSGLTDARQALAQIQEDDIAADRPGLWIYRQEKAALGKRLVQVDHRIAPVVG